MTNPLSKYTLTSDPQTWHNSPLVAVSQITPSGLSLLHTTATSMRQLVQQSKGSSTHLQNHILATIFYEPSTRTSCSFQAAMLRLGGTFMHVDATTSSTKKGETLSDTVRCLECYCDIIVLRHPDAGSVRSLVMEGEGGGGGGGGRKPVVNAGDGVGEHPTQALLDLFTMKDELGLDDEKSGGRDKLVVVMVGDLKHGRTVHSLGKLLARTEGLGRGMRIVLRYCSPDSLQMPDDVKDEISKCDLVTQEECTNLEQAVEGADVLYVTRIQKERFDSEADYNKVKGSYIVDTTLMSKAPKGMIVMHPLPRVDEISKEVDSDPRAAYFRQMENGMYVRMAILSLLLGKQL